METASFHIEKESSSSTASTDSSNSPHIKAASAPIYPLGQAASENQVKTQISAPSYLLSLSENDAPPFRKPGKEARRKILIGTIMTESEAVEMIAAADANQYYGLGKFLGDFLVQKKIILNYHFSEKRFLVSLLTETISYAAQRDFTAQKLACLITIYISTHLYFKWFYWLPPAALWRYFVEIMIRHTIEDSPDGQEVFEPEESYDILTHFHSAYMTNLPLVHIVSFGVHRLKLQWPFKPK